MFEAALVTHRALAFKAPAGRQHPMLRIAIELCLIQLPGAEFTVN
jgi:hypothetical protein